MTPSALVGALGKWSDGDGPVYRRLARTLEALIDRGEIEPGSRLPAERVLAAALAVSRTTVVVGLRRAARRRSASRAGEGAARACAVRPSRGPGLRLREDPSGSFRRHPVYRSLVDGPGDTIEFLGAHLPAPDMLPARARPTSTRSRCASSRAAPGTCRWVCRRCAGDRAAPRRAGASPTTEEQVMVTHGAQQAIGLAGALFLERGDTVVVEDPTYLGSIDIFAGLGRAPGDRAGRRRRGVARRGSGSSSPARRRGSST